MSTDDQTTGPTFGARSNLTVGSNRNPVQVLIADDHPIIVVALTEMLGTALGGSNVAVDSVADGDSLLRHLDANHPDYLVLDLHMPGRFKSIALVRAALARQPGLQVVIYTGSDRPCLALSALEIGAIGFVSKASGPQTVIEAIFSAMLGRSFVDPAVDVVSAKNHPWYQLTSGERTVVLALARGENLQAIALDSSRSYKTVTTHKYNALRKLGLRSNDEIGRYLENNGLTYLLE
ncbi:response regulator transcription factor [Lysobacter sp. BMK333-48F3]|uniref:response regulator transcription factor n=1 Tax=Lysobacter sp. BMK333-48F3 TaxID=2867962 RepID=UPI001C8C5A70|nr:response regulator transcription factor [Lysobacter sp. BMK333-48F3]MBX9400885.1 response regulator transcription factor [Lysobacter sp. BMK333-48F3]